VAARGVTDLEAVHAMSSSRGDGSLSCFIIVARREWKFFTRVIWKSTSARWI